MVLYAYAEIFMSRFPLVVVFLAVGVTSLLPSSSEANGPFSKAANGPLSSPNPAHSARQPKRRTVKGSFGLPDQIEVASRNYAIRSYDRPVGTYKGGFVRVVVDFRADTETVHYADGSKLVREEDGQREVAPGTSAYFARRTVSASVTSSR